MKFNYFFFLILFTCVSCNKQKDIPCISPPYETLNDNILISTPGFFKISGDYLYLTDLRAPDSIIQIFNAHTGTKLGSFGTIGNGPDEFQAPIISTAMDGCITILNAGTPKLGIYSAEKLLKNENPYSDLSPQPINDLSTVQLINENTYLYLSPEKNETLFKIIDKSNNTTQLFGETPIKKQGVYIDTENLYQGAFTYDYYNNYLLLEFVSIPKLVLFKKNNTTFEYVREKKLSNYEYDIINNKLSIKYLEPCRTKMASISKNYIILLDDSNISKEKRKEFKSPVISRRQLILLNYKLEPQKIIDLNMDIYLITSDSRSDNLYLVVANPEYSIIKITL